MIGAPADFARRLRRWYDANHRDLPWRLPAAARADGSIDPYKVLVSEAMLQQTQVATVIPYFLRFIELFPTVEALAGAPEQAVLRAWQGLGYYSRARNLQAAAKAIITDHERQVPSTVETLLTLPGVGRYTAGAIASIAFGRRAPILDGNVARVLCRVDAVRTDPRATQTRAALWARAEEILPRRNIGDFNSALMELGALICTPRAPQCLVCPMRGSCEAAALGLQDQIPPPRAAKPTPLLSRWTFCIRWKDRYLVQQRPATGRWAGMWQFVTVERTDEAPTANLVRTTLGLHVSTLKPLAIIEHALTHRRYRFEAFSCELRQPDNTGSRTWLSLQDLEDRPMPKPHVALHKLLQRDG